MSKWKKIGIGCGAFMLCSLVSVLCVSLSPESIPSSPEAPSITAETNTPTPAPSPTPTPIGFTRFAPAPFGQPVVNDQEIECTVLDVKRGPISGYMDNPHESREWVVVTIRLRNRCTRCETQYYSPHDFRIVGASGVIYDTHWSSDFTLPGGEFFRGAEVTGKFLMEAGIGETGLMIIWDPGAFIVSDPSARYLSLED